MALPTSLETPDKLGALISCRNFMMEKFNEKELFDTIIDTLKILSSTELKTVWFTGLNYTKNQIEYSKLGKIKSIIITNAKQKNPTD